MLLAFGCFAHDAESVLATVYGLALVIIKLHLNIGVWIRETRLELGITPFANADGRDWRFLHDPQFAIQHDCSLAHQAGRA